MSVPPEVLAAVRPLLARATHRGARTTSDVLVVRGLHGGAPPWGHELVGEDLAARFVSRARAIAYLGLIGGEHRASAHRAARTLLDMTAGAGPHNVVAMFVAIPARGNLTITSIDTRS